MTDYDFKIGAAFREITDELKNLRERIEKLEYEMRETHRVIDNINHRSTLLANTISSHTMEHAERIRQVEKEIAVLRSNVKEVDNILADFDEVEESNNE